MIENQRTKLRNWIEEYSLHVQMDIETPIHGEEKAEADFSGEVLPEEGQIRLWPATDAQWPPLYGLLLHAGYAQWAVLPFSELSLPAIPGELKVKKEPPVWVVQGWNARQLSDSEVKKSWAVDRIPEEQMFRINRWWLILQSGGDPSESLGEFCGPPLRHPLDPRHGYLESETLRADICLAEKTVLYTAETEMKKAAEPEERYGDAEGPEDHA